MVIKINIMKIKINDKCSSNYCEIKINHKMVKIESQKQFIIRDIKSNTYKK